MNKTALLDQIIAQLVEELECYVRAAKAAHAESTHEQSKAENKYDTRSLEASYLANGQTRQASELEASIASFQGLQDLEFKSGDPIGIGALVELQQSKEKMLYFIGAKAGGMEIVQESREILVITPQSPLGQQLMGKKVGDTLNLEFGGASTPSRISWVN